MSDIAGYIDRDIVKGHTYRLAGCPVPTVFTGNIDVISDDILVKAMVVVNDGNDRGTFPGGKAGTYLVNTIEYGNLTYLQSAVDCSDNREYRRIKSGSAEWTGWLSASDEVDRFDRRISDLEGNATADEGDIARLKLLVEGNTTTPGLTSRVNVIETANYGSQISDLRSGLNNKIKQVVITQNVKMSTVGETFGKFQLGTELAYPTNGVLIGMRVNTSHPGNITGVVYMLTYAANGTKPYINYQKGPNVTFNESHDFIFTFYIP